MKTHAPTNGNGNGAGSKIIPGAEHFAVSRTFTDVETTVVSAVVSTPLRLIDVLEHTEGDLFTIRETQFSGRSTGGAGVQHIRLYRHELERLHTITGRILGRNILAKEDRKSA